MIHTIKALSETVRDEVVFLRRELHKRAELSFEEYKTAAFIEDYLKELGIFVRSGVAQTGVLGYIDAGKKETVLLRADMDALPITEQEDAAYRSETEGVMHACGHDAHMAVLLAAAKCMVKRKELLSQNVLLVFQPGEETDGGALPMIETGILEEFGVCCALGLHVMNDIEAGSIRVKKGPLMASPDDFDLTIIGKGGHGAYPEKCIDPILVGTEIVSAFQKLIPQNSTPDEAAVISVCAINGGNNYNVIPDGVEMKGTVRTFNKAVRSEIPKKMEQEISRLCKKAGASYAFQFNFRYPPLVNNEAMAEKVAKHAACVLGADNVILGGEPSMAGEDFAYFADRVPSVFFYLGSGNKKSGIEMPLHNSRFKIDESCLQIGVEVYLSVLFNA